MPTEGGMREGLSERDLDVRPLAEIENECSKDSQEGMQDLKHEI